MTNTTPFISVVTAVYNGADYLPALIESVQAQTLTDYEHIIIDDGSTDDGATQAVIQRYATDDPHIRWWGRENKGAYPTQLEGLQAAQGDFVILINADDAFATPDVFAQFRAFVDQHPDKRLIYGRTGRLDETGRRLPQLDPHWRPSQWLIKQVCYVQHCSLFVSRDLLHTEQIWLNTDYRYVADWDWIIRLFRASEGKIGYLSSDVGCFRLHSGQRSRQALEAIRAESHALGRAYGARPWVHALIRRLLIIRAMLLIGLHTLRQQGPGAFLAKVRDWVQRHVWRSSTS